MKTKLKSGNTKKGFSKFPPNIASYYKDIKKAYTKYIGINRQKSGNMAGNPGIIRTNAHDMCNYIAKYDMGNYQIQAIMKLDGKLNFYKLVRAVRISIDAEPVLGCRFIKSATPYWKRFHDIDNIKFCSMEETDNPDEAVKRFLESPLDTDKGPMVKVRLIRSDTNDILGVKINHTCCDAAGAREYIQLLSDIYSHIDHNDGDFVLKPSIRSRKDDCRLLDAFGKNNPVPAWSLHKQMAMPTWKFPWKNCRHGATGFAVCRLPYGHLDIMKSYGKARGATVNDLILTAVYRAMFEISKPAYGVPMDIPVTIDLRRYLPGNKAEAIRNLSGGIVIKIARKAHEPFEGTLSRIMSMTKEIRNGHPSIKNLKLAECIEKMNFIQVCACFKAISQVVDIMSKNPFYIADKCSPILSNFGFISRSIIKFGKNAVTDAYIIPPVVRAPGILLVASTYNGIITLAVGYYKPSVRKTDMERLLNKIKDELVEGCRQ